MLRCLGKECSDRTLNLNNGGIYCTDSNFFHSECQFTCDVGYRLVGSNKTQCIEEEKNLKWNEETPTCESRF